MTLQWSAVAFFLYAEVAVNLILCIPFISARRWRLLFSWRLWNWLSPYWNKCFFTMIMVLIVLFLDAVREVQKYSGPEPTQDANVNPTLYDHIHMKLFRAQRNLYLSGFSLFLWLITRRVVTLLNQVAAASENSAALQEQVERAITEARRHQDDNRRLKETVVEEEKSMSAKNHQLKLEVEKLAGDLQTAEKDLHQSHAEVEAMKRQSKGLAQEYDRLLREHHQLQNLQCSNNKKEQ
ncbi:B-cell receptor-associated protein 29-like [Betta splendens]|uniref:Endoplasmic reticulum transmembrane protein n=1 Tax=Betta splendens TaxID=158456 RepID=A0A6P7MWB5_BETSP|nr:B-cell receptor-associated protein 29-like [Betta splendens]